jgi:hypothetical protein
VTLNHTFDKCDMQHRLRRGVRAFDRLDALGVDHRAM